MKQKEEETKLEEIFDEKSAEEEFENDPLNL